MEKVTIWSRMGHWIKRAPRPAQFDSGEAAFLSPGPDPAVVRSELSPRVSSSDEAAPPSNEESSGLSRFRLSRGPNLERLEEEYKRIVKVMDNIQAHLAHQDDRSEAMVAALDKIVLGVADLPGLARQQLDVLTQLQELANSHQRSMKRLEGELMQLPRLADAQREALVSLDRRLADSRQTGERMVTTMDFFRGSVDRLSDSSELAAKRMEDFRWDASAREERVAKLLETQTRRLTMFAAAASVLALIGMVIGTIALFANRP